MYLTGFADEASAGIDGQIAATKELGWTRIEARNIDKICLHDLDDAAFDAVCDKLANAGISVNCLGSSIGNWASQITDPFETALAQVSRSIPRMQRLGCRMVRIMSYAVLKDREPDDQMEQERFRRLREIKKRFDDAGLLPVHENCGNYGGMGWVYTLRLLENVPGLKLVFDTGNPVNTDDYLKPKPRPKQSSWEFYEHVREHVAYIHIKDAVFDPAANKLNFTYAGDGLGDVKKILADLVRRGYDGGISIEPHIGATLHPDKNLSDEEKRYQAYIEYGRRFMKLLDEVKNGR